MKSLIITFVMLAAVTVSAQQHFIVPQSPKQPISTECTNEVRSVQANIARIGTPNKEWHWVVVCDEETWTRILALAHDSETGYAFTILDKGYTYIRGSKVNGDEQFSGEYIIAHELGHIAMNSKDCRKADQWAKAALKHSKDVAQARPKPE